MQASTLAVSDRTRTASSATSISVPSQLAAVVFAATSVIVGLVWDISWHMTIGRDTFWTPAHLAIYIGGAVAGISCGFVVLRRSFFARGGDMSDSVTVWRLFRGPLGGWLCIWGAVAMLTSAPFDDWWHNAYGLDVKILSPPHTVLAVGFLGILIGAVLLAVAEQSRRPSNGAGWVVAYTSGLLLTIAAIMTYEYQSRVMMHMGIFYECASFVFPLFLVSAGVFVALRWPATATAAVYSMVMMLQLWVLPLFPASPLLGPIRQPVTHMVPLHFPLLVLPAAIVIDLVLQRTATQGAWTRALLAGVAFVVVFAAAQWPFAYFLRTPFAHGWFFHSNNLPYMMPMDSMEARGEFVQEPASAIATSFVIAGVLAVLASRLALGWGSWLRTVRR